MCSKYSYYIAQMYYIVHLRRDSVNTLPKKKKNFLKSNLLPICLVMNAPTWAFIPT